jgi:hypothetical protein
MSGFSDAKIIRPSYEGSNLFRREREVLRRGLGASFPTGVGCFLGNGGSAFRRKPLRPRFATLLPALAAYGNEMWIASIWVRLGEWTAVHLFADCLLYNAACDFHEVTLRV